MSDFLKRMVAKAKAELPLVRPVLGPRFGPEPILLEESPAFLDEAPVRLLPEPGTVDQPLGIEGLDAPARDVFGEESTTALPPEEEPAGSESARVSPAGETPAPEPGGDPAPADPEGKAEQAPAAKPTHERPEEIAEEPSQASGRVSGSIEEAVRERDAAMPAVPGLDDEVGPPAHGPPPGEIATPVPAPEQPAEREKLAGETMAEGSVERQSEPVSESDDRVVGGKTLQRRLAEPPAAEPPAAEQPAVESMPVTTPPAVAKPDDILQRRFEEEGGSEVPEAAPDEIMTPLAPSPLPSPTTEQPTAESVPVAAVAFETPVVETPPTAVRPGDALRPDDEAVPVAPPLDDEVRPETAPTRVGAPPAVPESPRRQDLGGETSAPGNAPGAITTGQTAPESPSPTSEAARDATPPSELSAETTSRAVPLAVEPQAGDALVAETSPERAESSDVLQRRAEVMPVVPALDEALGPEIHEAVPDEAVPGEAVPDEAVPDEAVPDEAVPGEMATPSPVAEASAPGVEAVADQTVTPDRVERAEAAPEDQAGASIDAGQTVQRRKEMTPVEGRHAGWPPRSAVLESSVSTVDDAVSSSEERLARSKSEAAQDVTPPVELSTDETSPVIRPAAEPPAAEPLAAEPLAVESPAAESPVAEPPIADSLAAEPPVADSPAVDSLAAQAPSVMAGPGDVFQRRAESTPVPASDEELGPETHETGPGELATPSPAAEASGVAPPEVVGGAQAGASVEAGQTVQRRKEMAPVESRHVGSSPRFQAVESQAGSKASGAITPGQTVPESPVSTVDDAVGSSERRPARSKPEATLDASPSGEPSADESSPVLPPSIEPPTLEPPIIDSPVADSTVDDSLSVETPPTMAGPGDVFQRRAESTPVPASDEESGPETHETGPGEMVTPSPAIEASAPVPTAVADQTSAPDRVERTEAATEVVEGDQAGASVEAGQTVQRRAETAPEIVEGDQAGASVEVGQTVQRRKETVPVESRHAGSSSKGAVLESSSGGQEAGAITPGQTVPESPVSTVDDAVGSSERRHASSTSDAALDAIPPGELSADETSRVIPLAIEPPMIEPPAADSPAAELPAADSSVVDSPAADSLSVETPSVTVGPGDVFQRRAESTPVPVSDEESGLETHETGSGEMATPSPAVEASAPVPTAVAGPTIAQDGSERTEAAPEVVEGDQAGASVEAGQTVQRWKETAPVESRHAVSSSKGAITPGQTVPESPDSTVDDAVGSSQRRHTPSKPEAALDATPPGELSADETSPVIPPAIEPPTVEPPINGPPVAEPPAADSLAADSPAVDLPAVDSLAVDSLVGEPLAAEPLVADSAVDSPTVDSPAVDSPAVDSPVVDSSAVETPPMAGPGDVFQRRVESTPVPASNGELGPETHERRSGEMATSSPAASAPESEATAGPTITPDRVERTEVTPEVVGGAQAGASVEVGQTVQRRKETAPVESRHAGPSPRSTALESQSGGQEAGAITPGQTVPESPVSTVDDAVGSFERRPAPSRPETALDATPAGELSADETSPVMLPAIEPPAIEPPAIDSPAVDSPAVDSPAVDSPVVDSPVVDASSVETPPMVGPGDVFQRRAVATPVPASDEALGSETHERTEAAPEVVGGGQSGASVEAGQAVQRRAETAAVADRPPGSSPRSQARESQAVGQETDAITPGRTVPESPVSAVDDAVGSAERRHAPSKPEAALDATPPVELSSDETSPVMRSVAEPPAADALILDAPPVTIEPSEVLQRRVEAMPVEPAPDEEVGSETHETVPGESLPGEITTPLPAEGPPASRRESLASVIRPEQAVLEASVQVPGASMDAIPPGVESVPAPVAPMDAPRPDEPSAVKTSPVAPPAVESPAVEPPAVEPPAVEPPAVESLAPAASPATVEPGDVLQRQVEATPAVPRSGGDVGPEAAPGEIGALLPVSEVPAPRRQAPAGKAIVQDEVERAEAEAGPVVQRRMEVAPVARHPTGPSPPIQEVEREQVAESNARAVPEPVPERPGEALGHPPAELSEIPRPAADPPGERQEVSLGGERVGSEPAARGDDDVGPGQVLQRRLAAAPVARPDALPPPRSQTLESRTRGQVPGEISPRRAMPESGVLESDASLDATRPDELSAVEMSPGVPPAVESLPVESLPVESLPVESLPVEFPPVESLPVESLPVATPPSTAHRGVVQRRVEASSVVPPSGGDVGAETASGEIAAPRPVSEPRVSRREPRPAAPAAAASIGEGRPVTGDTASVIQRRETTGAEPQISPSISAARIARPDSGRAESTTERRVVSTPTLPPAAVEGVSSAWAPPAGSPAELGLPVAVPETSAVAVSQAAEAPPGEASVAAGPSDHATAGPATAPLAASPAAPPALEPRLPGPWNPSGSNVDPTHEGVPARHTRVVIPLPGHSLRESAAAHQARIGVPPGVAPPATAPPATTTRITVPGPDVATATASKPSAGPPASPTSPASPASDAATKVPESTAPIGLEAPQRSPAEMATAMPVATLESMQESMRRLSLAATDAARGDRRASPPPAPTPPKLSVNIGRIDVRAAPPAEPPPAEPYRPRLTLADYENQRKAGLR